MRLTHEEPATTSFVGQSIAAWHGSSSKELPPLGRRYSEGEQQKRETLFDRFLQMVQTELQNLPRTRSARNKVCGRLAPAAARLAVFALDLDDAYLEPCCGRSSGNSVKIWL